MAAEPSPTRAGVPPHAAPIGRLVSSDSIPAGGFTPGAVLMGRYRIIGLIGRGGMGEVYRADDLKLGQAVALKFLPKVLSEDPVRRERLYAEVRIARQVSHPNICRVYDIGEIDGQHFLTMEFIDGEDLASLLQRIGHLHAEKALDVARQLCAGLGAAHERGVLHRDLKPANVMIDGRGRVRITDFGLAVAGEEGVSQEDISGTPAYMAPEQFAGKGSSVLSDIYALGLVLYELYTGRRAFKAKTLAELRAQKENSVPDAPSEIVRDIDAVVERIILRCIEKDPRQRPASAAQVAAALPGGDPLAAALAAGETPSPEMVAASVQTEGLRPMLAWTLLAVVMIGVFLSIPLNNRAYLVRRLPLEKPPEVFAERARNILKKFGYADPPADSAYGIDADMDYLQYVREHDHSAARYDNLPDSAVRFWYRQSPRALERVYFGAILNSPVVDPPLTFSGEALLYLDRRGRLLDLTVVPPQREEAPAPGVAADWPTVFVEAGLDPAQWATAQPAWTPLFYADARSAWTGSMPGSPGIPLRIEAASCRGKPVSFARIAPWTLPSRMTEAGSTGGQKAQSAIYAGIFVLVMAGGLLLARRNLRLGRGDRRGASRLALFVLAMVEISWVAGESHVAGIRELFLFIMSVSWALFVAGILWALYLALEPFVRRKWPSTLVSWSRLLAGDIRDPLVGRDMLVGFALGAVASILLASSLLAARWLGLPAESPYWTWGEFFLGTRRAVSLLVADVYDSMFWCFAIFFLLFALRLILRNRWAAGIVFVLLSAAPRTFGSYNWWVMAMFMVTCYLLFLFTLTRFGLLTGIAMMLFGQLLVDFPVTLRSPEWYAGTGFAGLLLLAGMAAYAFHTSLGGRPVFGGASLD